MKKIFFIIIFVLFAKLQAQIISSIQVDTIKNCLQIEEIISDFLLKNYSDKNIKEFTINYSDENNNHYFGTDTLCQQIIFHSTSTFGKIRIFDSHPYVHIIIIHHNYLYLINMSNSMEDILTAIQTNILNFPKMRELIYCIKKEHEKNWYFGSDIQITPYQGGFYTP